MDEETFRSQLHLAHRVVSICMDMDASIHRSQPGVADWSLSARWDDLHAIQKAISAVLDEGREVIEEAS